MAEGLAFEDSAGLGAVSSFADYFLAVAAAEAVEPVVAIGTEVLSY